MELCLQFSWCSQKQFPFLFVVIWKHVFLPNYSKPSRRMLICTSLQSKMNGTVFHSCRLLSFLASFSYETVQHYPCFTIQRSHGVSGAFPAFIQNLNESTCFQISCLGCIGCIWCCASFFPQTNAGHCFDRLVAQFEKLKGCKHKKMTWFSCMSTCCVCIGRKCPTTINHFMNKLAYCGFQW